eukprot:SM000095S24956  [mRNA]  locus=s95:89827:90384:+ [translate_table: standard]
MFNLGMAEADLEQLEHAKHWERIQAARMSFPLIGHYRAAEAWSPATFKTQVQPRKSNVGSTMAESIGILYEGVIEWNLPEAGIVSVELFGGAANGLKAVLQSHIKVAKYIYVHADEEARTVAKHHIDWLNPQYPTTKTEQTFTHWDTMLPQDITKAARSATYKLPKVDLSRQVFLVEVSAHLEVG